MSAAAAAAAAMVSPVTVVSERASEPVSGAAGAHRPGDWAAAGQAVGGRGRAGIPRRLASPGGEAGAVKGPAPGTRGAPPPRSPRPPAGGRKNSGHVTRKRDFVDVCVSDAGRRGGRQGERGDSSWPPGSAWTDHREAWERAGKGRRVTGTSWESWPNLFPPAPHPINKPGAREGTPLRPCSVGNALEEKGSSSLDHSSY